MHIQISYAGIETSEPLTQHINERIAHAMRHHGRRFTRVEVHLHDDNGGKNGANDKRCVIEARPMGYDPIKVEDASDDLYKSVAEGAKKLERAAQHFVERHANR